MSTTFASYYVNVIIAKIIELWLDDFLNSASDENLRRAYYPWSIVKNDQDMLHRILRENETILDSTLIERGFMNYEEGKFIRQVLRSGGQSIEARVERARADIDSVLSALPPAISLDPADIGRSTSRSEESAVRRPRARTSIPAEAALDRLAAMEQFAAALYRCLLFREPDLRGLANAVNDLCSGRLDFESALKSCLRSPEFRAKIDQFLARYMESDSPMRGETLTTLANRYKSDKGTAHGVPPHRYTYLYDLIFFNYRPHAINLLEIGVCAGGPEVGGPIDRTVSSPSLEMWLRFFPRAQIYGFDISDFSHLRDPRFRFIRGDAGSDEDLRRLAESASGYDIVVDDGSHASQHQQLAFKYLFPRLRAGGTYVIEDVHWQPSTYGQEHEALPKTADFFISYFERDLYLENRAISEEFMTMMRDQTAAFAWFPAFSGEASKPKLLVFTKIY